MAHAITAWAVWFALTHVPHITDMAATLAAGATFGLLAGWRARGAAERAMRRMVRRAFWRFGIRISLARSRRW